MIEVFRSILRAGFQGSVLILAVLLLRPFLAKAPKRFTCLLWILVGLRLLLPLNIESEFSLQPDVPGFELVQQQQEIVLPQFEPEQEVTPQVPAEPDNNVIPDQDNVQHPVSGSETADENHVVIDWTVIAAAIWLAAAAVLGIYCVVSYLRLKHRVREAVLLEDGIWESDRIDTAFILGYLRPRIYLPMYMDGNDRQLILEHERSHMRNGDHWVKLIGFIALAVHWFNPLVWVAYILLCRDLEMACDERVIRSMGLEERKSYSAALLSCSSNRAHFSACPVAFGEKPVRKRILAVLHYRKPGFWITLVALIAVLAVALFFLTSPVEKLDPLTLEDWGVTMSAEDAHFGGVTVRYDLPEQIDGNFMLHMGDWVLQADIDGKWVDVPMLPQEEPLTPWNGKVKTLFPNDGTHRMELDWVTVYGEMQPGSYRIRGTMTLNQGGYGYEKDFYAPFRIWDSEDQMISSKAWEEECRRVLEEIQNSDSYHIRRRGEFEGELLLDDWNQVSFWKYGENWLMILENQDSGELDGVWYDGIYGDLCLNGEYFSGYMSNQQMIWNRQEHLDPPELWLASFDMDAKNADAISREDTDEGYVIRLMIYEESDSPGLEYDAYYVDFHFDWDGNFRYAVQRIQATGDLMGETEAESMVLTMYAFECDKEAFNAVVDLYKSDADNVEVSGPTYTDSATACRVTEWFNPIISFDDTTKDYESSYAQYHFDKSVTEMDRDACVFCSDAILARLGLGKKPEIVILSDYDGAWTDGTTIYLGTDDFTSPEYGAELIANALGGYVNYGAAYGYAEYIAVQEEWCGARSYRVSLTNSDARDLNWLCFREEFVSNNEIKANIDASCAFVRDYINRNGEKAYQQLLRQSGDLNSLEVFNKALSDWYAAQGINYQPTEILYTFGGKYHDYIARCRYATFYLPETWENKHFSALAKDGNFLHESYSDVKRYYETSASQMAYIQKMFGVDEDTSEITVEFLLSGTGGTWAARNQIQLNYHAYIPRAYLNLMLFRHTEIRLHNGTYYEWLYHGLGEYVAQMAPSLYEDEILRYSVDHENRSYSTMEGEWYRIWQACVDGEKDPDQLWRTRWDLMAYYYGTDFSGEGCGYISFTAYLIDRIGLQNLWHYFLVTENESPEIDFAKYRSEWENYLTETYGQYPQFSDYNE